MTQGIILFAHGSRDPLWRAPMEAVATRVRALAPQAQVACAYLELTVPDMATVASQLVANGVTNLRVLPLFLGVGKHAREDLPVLIASLRQAHPGVPVELLPAVGENPQLLDLIAGIAVATPL